MSDAISISAMAPSCTKSRTKMALPRTIVLPVSGQAITAQLGMMLSLSFCGYKPDLWLGASGGAMVSSLFIRHNNEAKTVLAKLLNVQDVEILQKYPLGYLQSIMEPSIFLRGSGLIDLYHMMTDGNYQAFRDNELIINAYNTSVGQTELFTTAPRSKSILQSCTGPMQLLGVACNVGYLGDLPDAEFEIKLREVLMATSAVPVVFDSVRVGDHRYVDGGLSFSSPLTAVSCLEPMSDILYLNPTDIDQPVPIMYGSVLENAVGFTSQITRSNALQDRYMYLHGLCCGQFNQLKIIRGKVLANNLMTGGLNFGADLAKTVGHSRMVEIFPLVSNHIPMTQNQSRDDYLREIADAQQEFGYRIFYLEASVSVA